MGRYTSPPRIDRHGREVWTLDATDVEGPVGPEFRVNTFTTDGQWLPSIAMDAAGKFVIAWASRGQDGSDFGIFAQRYSAAGVPLGPQKVAGTDSRLGLN